MPFRHVKRKGVEQVELFNALDGPIQRLVVLVASIAMFIAGALSLALYHAWNEPEPVSEYVFEPLLVGRLDDDGTVVVEQTAGVPTIVAVDDEVTVPMVFSKCSGSDTDALSFLTVVADIGLGTPTLIPRDDPASIVVEKGCTGVVDTEVLIDTPPEVLRDGSFFSLRFRITADGKLPVLVETEPFLIAHEEPHGDLLVRPVPTP